MKRYISASNRRKRLIDITYFYREESGNEHKRASFYLGIGATYTTNFFRQQPGTVCQNWQLEFRGDKIVNLADAETVQDYVDSISYVIRNHRDLFPYDVDFSSCGRNDRILGILDSQYYGITIYLDDKSEFESVRNVLSEEGLVLS
jgi:hypothetical protein